MSSNPHTQKIIDQVNGEVKRLSDTGSDFNNLFAPIGPTKATRVMPDDSFKGITFAGGEEMLFTGLRAGKREEFLFLFEPTDDQPYKAIEFKKKDAMSMLPGFEQFLVKLVLPREENTELLNWSTACARLIEQLEHEAAFNTIGETGYRYEDNPNYGMF